MVRLLPGKALDGRAVRVHPEHVGLHGFLDHLVNTVVPLVVTGEAAGTLPRAADRQCREGDDLRLARHGEIAPGKIGKVLGKALDPTGFRYLAAYHIVDGHPVLRHLVGVSVRVQLFRRIEFRGFPRFASQLRLQDTGDVLPKVIDRPAVDLTDLSCLVAFKSPDRRQSGLLRLSLWNFVFVCRKRCAPRRVVIVRHGSAGREQSPPDLLRAVDIRVQDAVGLCSAGLIRADQRLRAVGIEHPQFKESDKALAEGKVGIGIGRHEGREVKAVPEALIPEIPAAADLQQQGVRPGAEKLGDVISPVQHQLVIIRPRRLEISIPDARAVEKGVILPEAAGCERRADGLFYQ